MDRFDYRNTFDLCRHGMSCCGLDLALAPFACGEAEESLSAGTACHATADASTDTASTAADTLLALR